MALDSIYQMIQQVLTSDEPLVISDAAAHPLMNLVREREQARAFSSLAILPILYEGRPLGVLFLRARQVHAFGDRELALCTTVSSANTRAEPSTISRSRATTGASSAAA